MFRIGQKVRVRGEKSYRGVITKDRSEFGWANIRDNKGRDHVCVHYNMIESRESGWHKSA